MWEKARRPGIGGPQRKRQVVLPFCSHLLAQAHPRPRLAHLAGLSPPLGPRCISQRGVSVKEQMNGRMCAPRRDSETQMSLMTQLVHRFLQQILRAGRRRCHPAWGKPGPERRGGRRKRPQGRGVRWRPQDGSPGGWGGGRGGGALPPSTWDGVMAPWENSDPCCSQDGHSFLVRWPTKSRGGPQTTGPPPYHTHTHMLICSHTHIHIPHTNTHYSQHTHSHTFIPPTHTIYKHAPLNNYTTHSHKFTLALLTPHTLNIHIPHANTHHSCIVHMHYTFTHSHTTNTHHTHIHLTHAHYI